MSTSALIISPGLRNCMHYYSTRTLVTYKHITSVALAGQILASHTRSCRPVIRADCNNSLLVLGRRMVAGSASRILAALQVPLGGASPVTSTGSCT